MIKKERRTRDEKFYDFMEKSSTAAGRILKHKMREEENEKLEKVLHVSKDLSASELADLYEEMYE